MGAFNSIRFRSKERIIKLNFQINGRCNYVLYWMQQSQRLSDTPLFRRPEQGGRLEYHNPAPYHDLPHLFYRPVPLKTGGVKRSVGGTGGQKIKSSAFFSI